MSELVRVDQARKLMQLFREVDEFREDDSGRAQHLIAGICTVVDAELAASAHQSEFKPGAQGECRVDVVVGGDVGLASVIHVLVERGFEYHPVGAAAVRAMRGTPNELIAATRSELVPDRQWYRSPFYEECLEPVGLDHLVFSVRSCGVGRSAHGLGFYRRRNARAFDREDRNLLKLFHAGVQARLSPSRLVAPTPSEVSDVDYAFERRVREAVRRGFLVGRTGVEWVAGELGTSTRTLHRGLLRGNLRFFDLVDQERKEWAESSLGGGHVDAQFLATSLGFQTQTAFRKAFKRWTNLSPTEYRRVAHRGMELGPQE